MDEFDFIETYFRPLAKGFNGSLNLSDDAALVRVPTGYELVITKDAISEGIHYLGTEDPALIAKKLLRTNLSDLAAKGATPLCYFLALMLPANTRADWLKRFAEGLAEDQSLFSIHLAGGDTTSTRGTASFSVTALGTVRSDHMTPRSGARVGDTVYVSGTLGDSALGLGLLQNKIKAALSSDNRHWLEHRYYLPEPRLALGQKLSGIATAAMDVSDGLVQDLEHLCKASGVAATVSRQLLPLSVAGEALVAADAHHWMSVLAGGDDYEILFTAPAKKESAIAKLSAELGVQVTAIGKITKGAGVQVVDENDKPLHITRKGFRHFA